MSKILQVVIYKSISDEGKLAAYAELAGPAMKAGVAVFFTQYSITPTRLALELEERGYESLWAPEHSHVPVSRNSDFPKGGVLPEKYQDVMDPFVTLSVAAAVTTLLKIATGICLVVH